MFEVFVNLTQVSEDLPSVDLEDDEEERLEKEKEKQRKRELHRFVAEEIDEMSRDGCCDIFCDFLNGLCNAM